MHSFFSNLAPGDTVCMTLDVLSEIPQDERELGMITGVTFTYAGVLYNVSWQGREEDMRTPQELTLVSAAVTSKEKNDPLEN
jgi:hypothetical protein